MSAAAGGAAHEAPSRAKIVAAFAAVYVIWGSTYLAIRIAIDTLPPFLMAGARFLVAGALMFAWARLRGAPEPTRAHWRSAAIIGGLLLLGGNGAVVWAEQFVPSGLASLIVATTPIWMVGLDWARRDGVRPTRGVLAGLAMGLVGLAVLVGPGSILAISAASIAGALVLLLGSLSWSAGSLVSRHAPLPASAPLATGMEMLAGGALLALLGLATGEGGSVATMQASAASIAALAYLVVFGSLVGFSAYIWLLRVSTPARVATYAYVNPIVAVFLGWAVLGEPVTLRTMLAAGIIVAAVALITITRRVPPESVAAAPAVPERPRELRPGARARARTRRARPLG